jgi:hypothetical protein
MGFKFSAHRGHLKDVEKESESYLCLHTSLGEATGTVLPSHRKMPMKLTHNDCRNEKSEKKDEAKFSLGTTLENPNMVFGRQEAKNIIL